MAYICLNAFVLMPLRPSVFLYAFTLFAPVCKAQDLLITITGDTIRCRVEQSNEQFVYYRTLKTRRGEQDVISRKEVREVVYAAYEAGVKERNALADRGRKFSPGLWGGGGWSVLVDNGQEPGENLEAYYRQLRSGYWVGGGAYFMLSQELGLGGIYSISRFANSIGVQLSNQQNVVIRTGILSDDIRIQYIGAGLVLRLGADTDWYRLQLNIGPGLNLYRNDARFFFDYALRSTGVGGHMSLEGLLNLGQGMSLGVHAGFKGIQNTSLKAEYTDGIPDDVFELLKLLNENQRPLNVLRLDVGVSFHIQF